MRIEARKEWLDCQARCVVEQLSRASHVTCQYQSERRGMIGRKDCMCTEEGREWNKTMREEEGGMEKIKEHFA